MGGTPRIRSALAGVAASALALALLPAAAEALPRGFSDRVVHRGLDAPTGIAIAPDGTHFIGEKAGTIRLFDGPADKTPRLVADLSDEVMSAYDRGLEAIALDPAYPARPYLYASYTHDAPIGGRAPTWGEPGGGGEDWCKPPAPPEPDPTLEEGCLVSGRVARIKLDARGVATSRRVLLEDWCQQFDSHSMGGIAFDEDGALLVAGGDGAAYTRVDIGQLGTPPNPCGDPPAQGGALRAQDLVMPGDPVGLGGTVVRIDPDTGRPHPGNPSGAPGNAGRIVAYGLRNPFRLTVRPGTDELWIADVGWDGFEEINTAPVSQQTNFGWPCFEGAAKEPDYARAGTAACDALYAQEAAVTAPWFAYEHHFPAVPDDECFTFEGALSGIAFDGSREFPLPYDGALFVADYVRGCILSFLPGRGGRPLRGTGASFNPDAPVPVDLVSAPEGLYYADVWGGTVRLIGYEGATVEVRAVSRPRGATINLGGRRTGGLPLTLEKATRYRLGAARTLERGGRTLHFHHWSDGGRRIHRIAPSGNLRLEAVYRER